MANPNIVGTTAIYGKTDVAAVGTALTSITANSAGSNKVYKVNTLMMSNIDTSTAVSVSVNVDFYRASTTSARSIAKAIAVPAASTLVVVAKDSPIYLTEGDSIRVSASAAGDVEAVCSYEEIS